MARYVDTREILDEVFDERRRQDAKWGYVKQTMEQRLAILAVEFSKYAMEVVEHKSNNMACHLHNMREELVQIAAVAVANIERIDLEHGDELDKFYGNRGY